MLFKVFALAALVAATNAGVAPLVYSTAPLAYAAPLAKAVVSEAYAPHPQYSYVDDHLTGDSKTQEEHREGDVVHGSYSLTDADGYRRTVDYNADPIHGFNAVVRREPPAVKVAKVAAPAHYAAPIAHAVYYHH